MNYRFSLTWFFIALSFQCQGFKALDSYESLVLKHETTNVSYSEESLRSINSHKCKIEFDRLRGVIFPLITSNGTFKYPEYADHNGHPVIYIEEEETVQLTCHNKDSLVSGGPKSTKLRTINLTCSKKKFRQSKKIVYIHSLHCSQPHEPLIKKVPAKLPKYTHLFKVLIGWEIQSIFITQIEALVNDKDYSTLWTRHNVEGKSIKYKFIDGKRPPFKGGVSNTHRFFGGASSTQLNKIYSKTEQVEAVKNILGKNEFKGETIISLDKSSNNFFAKGHLSPDADFVYGAEQDATYFFMNVAPQFQSFNNGNWKALENAVRGYAERLRSNITVYSGTYGHLKYNKKAISLYERKYIPAPAYYWKIVFNPLKTEAVGFVGVNNPHLRKAPSKICPDVCDKLTWIHWDRNSIEKGFMYCCTVSDLRKAIPIVPEIGIKLLES